MADMTALPRTHPTPSAEGPLAPRVYRYYDLLMVAFVTVLQQAIQDFGKWNQMVFGALVVLVVLIFRGGIWGGVQLLAQQATSLLPRRDPAEMGGIGAVRGKKSE